MKKERLTTTVGRLENYAAPTCEIIEMQSEGMLCGSGDDGEKNVTATHQGFEDSEEELEW